MKLKELKMKNTKSFRLSLILKKNIFVVGSLKYFILDKYLKNLKARK